MKMQDKFIILAGDNGIPVWLDDSGKLRVYDTAKEATVSLIEDFIHSLRSQLDELQEDARSVEDIDTELDEWVEPCTLHEDGRISTEAVDNLMSHYKANT